MSLQASEDGRSYLRPTYYLSTTYVLPIYQVNLKQGVGKVLAMWFADLGCKFSFLRLEAVDGLIIKNCSQLTVVRGTTDLCLL